LYKIYTNSFGGKISYTNDHNATSLQLEPQKKLDEE